jgi:uncharacterized protein YlxW (UPF0749 family)
MGLEGDRSGAVWRVLVPVTFLGAGLLFSASHETAQGTDLRAGRLSQLTDLIDASQQQVADLERTAGGLRRDVAARQADLASGSSSVAAETRRGDALRSPAGLEAVVGPGLVVTLDDAPRPAEGEEPASDNPDDLVVHQQDVQSVLNALWAGGAEAVSVMGDRVISTSAVRCVGNTLLIDGRLVGPPFVMRAIGDVAGMRSALAVEPGVALFRRYVDAYGLTYAVGTERRLHLPAYDGALTLPHVERS